MKSSALIHVEIFVILMIEIGVFRERDNEKLLVEFGIFLQVLQRAASDKFPPGGPVIQIDDQDVFSSILSSQSLAENPRNSSTISHFVDERLAYRRRTADHIDLFLLSLQFDKQREGRFSWPIGSKGTIASSSCSSRIRSRILNSGPLGNFRRRARNLSSSRRNWFQIVSPLRRCFFSAWKISSPLRIVLWMSPIDSCLTPPTRRKKLRQSAWVNRKRIAAILSLVSGG